MTEDVIGFLKARLDEEADMASAAARQIAERACPPPEVDDYLVRGGSWATRPWLFTRRAEADLGPMGRVEIATIATDHIARQDPARTLRRIASQRKTIALYEQVAHVLDTFADKGAGYSVLLGETAVLRRVLEALATVYDDHPDFHPKWRR